MEQKKISIIVPVYNAEYYLDRCITSVKKQSYSNWELILVDDGSQDNSCNVCKQHILQDDRIMLICNNHGGTAKARNTALCIANGDYIAFLDADDAYHPRFLELMVGAAEKYRCDIALCKIIRGTYSTAFFSSSVVSAPKLLTVKETMTRLYKGDWTDVIAPCTKIYKKEIFNVLRFPDGRFFEDAATIYRAIYYSNQIVDVGTALYFYNETPNSSSKTKSAYELLDREWALRSHWEFYREEGRADIERLAVAFYLQELVMIHYKIQNSDMPEKCKIIEDRFDDTYRQYRNKLSLSKQQKELFFSFRHPKLFDVYNMIQRDGVFKTAAGFINRKRRKNK